MYICVYIYDQESYIFSIIHTHMIKNFLLIFLQRNEVERSPCNFYGRKDRITKTNHDKGKKNTDLLAKTLD